MKINIRDEIYFFQGMDIEKNDRRGFKITQQYNSADGVEITITYPNVHIEDTVKNDMSELLDMKPFELLKDYEILADQDDNGVLATINIPDNDCDCEPVTDCGEES